MNLRLSAPRDTWRERKPSGPLGFFAQDSLEPAAELVKTDIQAPSDPQQRAEPRVDGASLQLADAVELGANPLREALLGQVRLTAQFFNYLPESCVVGRSRFGSAAGRHAPRQPSRLRATLLDVIAANAIYWERHAESDRPRLYEYRYGAAGNQLVRLAANRESARGKACESRTRAIPPPANNLLVGGIHA